MEEDYFARLDRERLDKIKTKQDASEAEAEAQRLREVHHHRCGKCGSTMSTTLFRGVDIEVCDDCGAVLLDKGELHALAGEDKSGVLSGLLSLFPGRDTS